MCTGAHVVLVDDLVRPCLLYLNAILALCMMTSFVQVQTGGTLINCAECVKKAGAVAVSCFVTHAVFPKQSWKKFVTGAGPFETFFITDSIPQVSAELASQAPFEVISLAPLLRDSIYDSIYQA